jgi:hypothetical protein
VAREAGLLRRLRHPQLYDVWARALRERADQTRIVAVRRGTIEVEVASAALLQDLDFQRHDLARLLQAEVREPHIERIHFRLGSFERGTDEGGRDRSAGG